MNGCPRQNPAYGRLSLSLYKSIAYTFAVISVAGIRAIGAAATGNWRQSQCCRRLATIM
jgi:hypothetical protein